MMLRAQRALRCTCLLITALSVVASASFSRHPRGARPELSLQETVFGLATGARERCPERVRSFDISAEIHQTLTPHGEQQMVMTQLRIALEACDRRERLRRTADFRERHR